ncbi:OLC1v1016229C1 [Oldenlandia corymbosa var. corymbosa]|uniref:OLC1v1016229C1 n=1 Tax=Oldenlandia corymbosa var. corymbosa TaxID=529605 RepID=A0AAV1E7B2_OLDCO|nr:OLC1v1016229C1 [Oldenlandia corymbosa var. corymbosa]
MQSLSILSPSCLPPLFAGGNVTRTPTNLRLASLSVAGHHRTIIHGHNRNLLRIMSSASTIGTDSGMGTGSAVGAPKWVQKTITLPRQSRGCHLITSKILKEIGQELSGFKCGLAHFFLQHTSASLTINENYDSDVRDDTETFLNRIVPEGRSAPWKHTMEGPDDMPAHVKSSMFGCTLTIPITNGKLNMGTWQGVWLCEHRDSATPRTIVVTMNGI